MKHDEKEADLVAWLSIIGQIEFAEELLYMPSTLTKLGIKPEDVPDRLDWLREADHLPSMVDHATIRVSSRYGKHGRRRSTRR